MLNFQHGTQQPRSVAPPASRGTPSLPLPSTPTHTPRTIQITTGPCSYRFQPSGLECPCALGSCIAYSDAAMEWARCQDCDHPILQHNNYAAVPYARFLLNTTSESLICPRATTVRRIAERLDKLHVLHIRGTPTSGKTTLAALLYNHYDQLQRPVVWMPRWDAPSGCAIQWLIRQSHAAGYHITPKNFASWNVTFILDEAQTSYSDRGLWLDFIKARSGACYEGPNICLLAAYGSPSSGPEEFPRGTTPTHLGLQQRVSITRSRNPHSPQVSLFYDEEEFEDVVNRRCSKPATNIINLDSGARRCLFSVTNGHPGAVEALFDYIFETYRTDLKKGTLSQITDELVIGALDDEANVFMSINSAPVARSFPKDKHLTAAAADVLRQVLQEGRIKYDFDNAGIRRCFEMGWLHIDDSEVSTFIHPDLICFLPSKLHEKYVEFTLGANGPTAFPDSIKSPAMLCEMVLRQFSRKNLLSGKSRNPIASTSVRPPEAQFQDEWYRAFFSVVGHGVGISSEWSCAAGGRIDFRIIEPKWGIELLRDGDRVTEHCERFLHHGKYHRWIEEGTIQDWLILDCRHSRPLKYAVEGTKLWRVVFREDYRSAYVLDCDNVIVVEEFPLLN